MAGVYLRGMLVSFALVSSIGMQNIFMFNQAMSQRLRRAFLIAFFVWVADTALTAVAFLGLGSIIASNAVLKVTIMLIGGAVVVWMGWGILRSAHSAQFGNDSQVLTLREAFGEAWIVAFANPQALVDTSVTLGALRSTLTAAQAIPFLLGIITSTAIWFVAITTLIGLLKNRLPRRLLMWVNIISGFIVMGYGVVLIFHAGQAIVGALF
ncbi:LysE/ArgO family amino acid transporter [Lacticaseibacillus mingshuiensis]|uniref:LysE/ArgO family amino acid transporter n=1 Tax=Lacticaseibacillus mingshuiensis TaxID=2799574 RepID=A0ABW4CGH6_9LACO|nr:LysE family transporter [Lacticaseibacillus mingshuiensis]